MCEKCNYISDFYYLSHNYCAQDKLVLCSLTQRMIIGDREEGYEERKR